MSGQASAGPVARHPPLAPPASGITLQRIFAFWWPLALTGTMMALTPALINFGIAAGLKIQGVRLGLDAATTAQSITRELAAFGLAFALSRLLHSPLLYLTHACLRFTGDEAGRLRAAKFCAQASVATVLIKLLVAFSPLGMLILSGPMAVPASLREETLSLFRALVLLPLPMGLRSFGHALLMRGEVTPPVSIGTAIRIVLISVGLLVGPNWLGLSGGLSGILAFLAGLTLEGLWVARAAIKHGLWPTHLSRAFSHFTLPDRAVWKFAGPLLATGLLGVVDRTILNAALARGPEPEAALAAFQVTSGLMFLVTAPGTMVQQSAQSLVRSQADLKVLARFARRVTLVLIGFTLFTELPFVADFILAFGHGLAGPVLTEAQLSWLVLLPLPACVILRSFWQGANLVGGDSTRVGLFATVRLVGMFFGGLALVNVAPSHGAAWISAWWMAVMLVEAALLARGFVRSERGGCFSGSPDYSAPVPKT